MLFRNNTDNQWPGLPPMGRPSPVGMPVPGTSPIGGGTPATPVSSPPRLGRPQPPVWGGLPPMRPQYGR